MTVLRGLRPEQTKQALLKNLCIAIVPIKPYMRLEVSE